MKRTTPLFLNAAILAVASRQMLEGAEHLVVPVIAAREGVMNGFFYSSAELSVTANAWNGVPVPVGHPKDEAGAFVSANSPEIDAKWNVGRFWNVNWDDKTKALKGEIWLNVARATALGHGDLLNRLEVNNETIDVSTGLFSGQVDEGGQYLGETYSAKINGIVPDHLAILPNEKGACSVDKGCGTFQLNHDHGDACCGSCADKAKKAQRPKGLLGNLSSLVLNVLGIKSNEASHDQIREGLRTTLRQQSYLAKDSWPYILDVYDTFFVYEVDGLLFKQGYAMDAAEVAQLIGDRIQVIIKREYVEVAHLQTNNDTTVKQTPVVTAILAAALTANSLSAEEHAHLTALPEGTLDKLLNNTPAAPATAPAATSAAPVVNGLSNDDRALLERLKANEDRRLTGLRTNTKAAYPKMSPELIDRMDSDTLEGLLTNAGASTVVDFSLGGGAAPATVKANETYTPPSIVGRTGD